MSKKEKVIEINGRKLPKDDVDSFLSMWDMFTYHNHATPEPLVKLLAYTYITRDLPTEEILNEHGIDEKQFTSNLKFYERQLAEDRRITAQMREEDDANFLCSPLLSKEMWELFHGGEQ